MGIGGVMTLVDQVLIASLLPFEEGSFMEFIFSALHIPATILWVVWNYLDPLQGVRESMYAADRSLVCGLLGLMINPIFYAFVIFLTWTGVAGIFKRMKKN